MDTLKFDSFQLGNHYDSVAAKAKEIATEKGVVVEFEFNGRSNFVNKDTNLEHLWRDYSNSWYTDWKDIGPNPAPEYSSEIQEQLTKAIAKSKADEEQRFKEIEAEDARQKAEFEAIVGDTQILLISGKEDEYRDYVATNSKDGYSRAVIDYAEGWAKLMQIEMAKGSPLVEIAESTQKGLGFLGITGFQFGCVMKTLTHFWIHGEPLRKWHNKEYNHEGEGVVNPAIMTLSTD